MRLALPGDFDGVKLDDLEARRIQRPQLLFRGEVELGPERRGPALARSIARGSSPRGWIIMREPKLRVRPLRRGDWKIVETLFTQRGACGGCWCMWWRVERGGRLWEFSKGEPNRRALKQRIEKDEVHAVLAFADGAPVGWCSFGPRTTFPRLETVKALRGRYPDDTWSIVCFFVPARWRGRGIATALLDAAAERAFQLGAGRLEGYPVVPKEKSKPVPAAFAWTGVPSLFRKAVFRRRRRAASLRPIYVKE
jgi:GNAT superfamily N-acetyltransferase